VVFTTVVNMIGVKLMSRINNVGVLAELIGVTLLIIFLAFHITRGPGVVFHTNGTGAGHEWGYFGAFLIGGIVSTYVFYGFDTAGSLAEETNNPRKHAPPAILRAIAAAGLAGGLLMLVAMMAVGNITAKEIGTLGLPFVVKDTLGETLGDIFLLDSAVAITVCCLAVHTAGIRMMFSMARDNRLPLGSAVARVSGKSKTPIVPALVIGGLTIVLLLINIGNQRVFFVLISVAIILFYLAYTCVTAPLLLARLRGDWPPKDHGPYFSLGRWGLPVNIAAVVYQVIAIVNLAWPREAVYGGDHWYFQAGGVTFTGFFLIVGAVYYFTVQRDKAAEPLPEHRAEIDAALAQTCRRRSGLGERARWTRSPRSCGPIRRSTRCPRRRSTGSPRPRGRPRSPTARPSSPRERPRRRARGSCATAASSSSTTAGCSTSSAPASCSATRRCSPSCRPASPPGRTAPPSASASPAT
jgi:amino acid transporter